MFRHLRAHRAARRLHEAHPEIPLPVARTRAWRMVQRYPRAATWRITEYLVYDVHVSKMITNLNRNMHEAPTEETR